MTYSISIHAPREGSDARVQREAELDRKISIHAPREGSDGEYLLPLPKLSEFLSTLPARGATWTWSAPAARTTDFYPRSPRGERRWTTRCWTLWSDFYPRSPRGERQIGPYSAYAIAVFLSTLPARGATNWVNKYKEAKYISIHAPREGSDGRRRCVVSG